MNGMRYHWLLFRVFRLTKSLTSFLQRNLKPRNIYASWLDKRLLKSRLARRCWSTKIYSMIFFADVPGRTRLPPWEASSRPLHIHQTTWSRAPKRSGAPAGFPAGAHAADNVPWRGTPWECKYPFFIILAVSNYTLIGINHFQTQNTLLKFYEK